LDEVGSVNVTVAKQILDWMKENNIEVSWSKSQIGSFKPHFMSGDGKYFYPFAISGDAKITWNAPHQGDHSPSPFDKSDNRQEILKQLEKIEGAQVDVENVDGYNGCRIPLDQLEKEESIQKFFEVCLWIQEEMNS
jgi:hypothetical protein